MLVKWLIFNGMCNKIKTSTFLRRFFIVLVYYKIVTAIKSKKVFKSEDPIEAFVFIDFTGLIDGLRVNTGNHVGTLSSLIVYQGL